MTAPQSPSDPPSDPSFDPSFDPSSNPPPRSVGGWIFVSLVMMGSLVAMTGLRQFLFDALESSGPNVAWFIVQVIPLLVPLPGLLSGRILATFTVCMASLLYFVHGVMAAFDPNFLVYGLFEIGFALGLCASTSMLLRKLRT